MTRKNPFERPGETPQQTGRRFEGFWSKFFGKEPTRGSGNLWHLPLDLSFAVLHFSLKYSKRGRLRFGDYSMKELLREADKARKDDAHIGLVATYGEEDAEVYVTLRGTDFLRLIQSGDIQYLTPSKGEQKRRRASVPALLRDEDEAP
jgi:hypothetical protein